MISQAIQRSVRLALVEIRSILVMLFITGETLVHGFAASQAIIGIVRLACVVVSAIHPVIVGALCTLLDCSALCQAIGRIVHITLIGIPSVKPVSNRASQALIGNGALGSTIDSSVFETQPRDIQIFASRATGALVIIRVSQTTPKSAHITCKACINIKSTHTRGTAISASFGHVAVFLCRTSTGLGALPVDIAAGRTQVF